MEGKLTYTASSKDPKTGKTGTIHFMIEQYIQDTSAVSAYRSIKSANENHEGVKTVHDMGDDAYFHSDGTNFYFILVRKGNIMFRIKVNKLTSHTSMEEFNRISKKISRCPLNNIYSLKMKLQIDTIILFVQNVDKLKSFYVDILKLVTVEEIKSEWLLLKAGECQIGLHKIGDQYLEIKQDAFKLDNNTKIVFTVDEDIYKVRTQLLTENVLMKEIKTFEHYDFILCDGEDPEGNVFQLKQKKMIAKLS